MPPIIATLLWFLCLVALFVFDPAKEPRNSWALWMPLSWMFIVATRLPSQWFGSGLGQSAQALEEGNPLDRAILGVLILIAIVILANRSFQWGKFFTQNFALAMFLSFALLSVVWSDFPLIAAKRWFRDLGNYFVALLILTDPLPDIAVRTVFRRFSYVVLSLSVMLNKYYPQMSKQYDAWTGMPEYIGAATSKNTLGLICLVTGLFLFWDTVSRWSIRKEGRNRQVLLVNAAFLGMSIWLLNVCNSATSKACLGIGCMVILAAHTSIFVKRPRLLTVSIPLVAIAYVILAYGFNINAHIATAMGRDPTLTDRTKIWAIVLSMGTNPVIGTGYESFWLGPRLVYFWTRGLGRINEAHNGYLEVYLQLGMVGVALLMCFLLAGYRKICGRLKPMVGVGSFGLAIWAVAIFYNITEAAFKGGLLWITIIIASITVRRHTREESQSNGLGHEDVSSTELESTGASL